MSHNFLFHSSFHMLLNIIDSNIAEQARIQGCHYCGGKLYRADYPRSPLGVPVEHRKHYEERYSFCCCQCHKRTTTPSVRFFGRYWYPAPLLILISALKHRATDKLCARLNRLFGITINKKTWKRWRRWWQETFSTTDFWKSNAGIIPIAQLQGSFPRTLLVSYSGTLKHRLVSFLEFLAPMTAGDLRAV